MQMFSVVNNLLHKNDYIVTMWELGAFLSDFTVGLILRTTLVACLTGPFGRLYDPENKPGGFTT